MSHNLSISIEYKTIDSSQWHIIELLPEDYFYLVDLEPDEVLEWDSVPEYDDAIDYLDIEPNLVSNTRLRISDIEAQITKVITETFWNQGNNRIVERIDSRNSEVFYWLMIIDTKVQDNPTIWEILRIEKEDNLPKISHHSFIKDNEDGSQAEMNIYPDNSRSFQY